MLILMGNFIPLVLSSSFTQMRASICKTPQTPVPEQKGNFSFQTYLGSWRAGNRSLVLQDIYILAK